MSVPKLRFPEFQNAPEWDEKKLHQIAQSVSDKVTNSDTNKILTLSSEYGIVLQSEYFGKKIAGENVERYIKIAHNDFVYNDRTTKLFAYGTIKRLSQYESGIVSPIYKCFRFNDGENPIFWEWYFESGFHEAQLHSLVNEGARAGRFNISIEKFLSTIIWQPAPPEQQKIADCLSSIDELIAAHSQKLATLKAHKKGLLQQLFPAEGETLPQLRFPEFQDAPGWEEKQLKDISSSIFDGTHQTPTYTTEGVPFYSVENIISGNKNKFISREDYIVTTSKNKPKKDDILLTRIGKIGYSQVVTWDHDFSVYVTLAVIKQSKSFDSHYLHYFMQSNRYQTEILKKSLLNAVPPKINMDSLRNTEILLPAPSEQLKIADCLSSIDELIAAQSQKLATLKAHTKGLMQQLFPSSDEVPG